MLEHVTVPVTDFAQNASLIWCSTTRAAAWVDPGGEPELLLTVTLEQNVQPVCILLTHGHLDHVGAARTLADRLGVPILGPGIGDRFWLDQLPEQGQMFGMPALAPLTPDRWLVDGEVIPLGDRRLRVLSCPGHTPGHVVFFDAEARLAFVGDVLFAGSIGRTDFPLGNHRDLLNSITGKLWPLGHDVRFVPGHGPMSTFGRERASNPHVGDRVLGKAYS